MGLSGILFRNLSRSLLNIAKDPLQSLKGLGKQLKSCGPLIGNELSTIVFIRAEALVAMGGTLHILPNRLIS